ADLELSYDGTLFTPVSELNRVRREFFIQAGEILIASYRPLPEEVEAAKKRLAPFIAGHPAPVSPTPQKTPESPKRGAMSIILYADSMDAVDAGTRAGAKTICFEPAGFPYPSGADAESENARIEAAIRIALGTCRAHDARLIWKLPRITRQGEIDVIRGL